MGRRWQKDVKLNNLCVCRGCTRSQTAGLPVCPPTHPPVINPKAAYGELH